MIADDNKITKSEALYSLHPNSRWVLRGDTLEWNDKETKAPSDDEIETEQLRLQAEYDSQEYARTRKSLYPEIGDQLDALYHAGAFPSDMAAKIKKVKDDNPKK